MKFKKTLTSRATVRKQKEYEFNDITDEQIKEGRKRKFENPLFINGKLGYYLLYSMRKKLTVTLLHSYDKFEELKDAPEKKGVKK